MSTKNSGRWGPYRQASPSPAIVDLSFHGSSAISAMTCSRLRIDHPYQGDPHVDPKLLQIPDFDFNTAAANPPASFGFATVARSLGGPQPAVVCGFAGPERSRPSAGWRGDHL